MLLLVSFFTCVHQTTDSCVWYQLIESCYHYFHYCYLSIHQYCIQSIKFTLLLHLFVVLLLRFYFILIYWVGHFRIAICMLFFSDFLSFCWIFQPRDTLTLSFTCIFAYSFKSVIILSTLKYFVCNFNNFPIFIFKAWRLRNPWQTFCFPIFL